MCHRTGRRLRNRPHARRTGRAGFGPGYEFVQRGVASPAAVDRADFCAEAIFGSEARSRPQREQAGREGVLLCQQVHRPKDGGRHAHGPARIDNAASKTLAPSGPTARVTNLQTGRSAVVTIQDRGPYVKGRIVDLSPATAREIVISRERRHRTGRSAPVVDTAMTKCPPRSGRR